MSAKPFIARNGLCSLAVGLAASLSVAVGTLYDASNRIGFYADTTASAEKLAMVVGGIAGTTYTRSGSVVNVAHTGAVAIADTTAASSSTTGSFKTAGGAGVAGALYAGGLINSASTITGTQLISTVATGTGPLVVTSTTVVTNLNASLLLGGTWASPGAIGGTTAAAGSFTSLTDSGLTSGRVTFATTAGLLTDSANLTYASGTLKVNDATASSSTTTGALVLTGGAGIGGNVWIGGTLNATGTSTFAAISGTGVLATVIGSPAATPSWLSADGVRFSQVSNQIINAHIGTAGGTVAFVMSVGATRAYSYFSLDTSSNLLQIGNNSANRVTIDSSGNVAVLASTASTSAATGALVVTGGAGVGGKLFVGDIGTFKGATTGMVIGQWPFSSGWGLIGNSTLDQSLVGNYALIQSSSGQTAVNAASGQTVSIRIANSDSLTASGTVVTVPLSTASSSTTTGALVVTGGVGIGGAINVAFTSTFPGIIANGVSGAAAVDMQPSDTYATPQYMTLLLTPKYNSGGGTTTVAAMRMQRTSSADGTYDGVVSLLARATGGSLTETVRAMMPGSANQVGLQVYDQNSATLKQVTVGAVDSGGAGFRLLRIPN